jgi:hypothetical protein
MDPQEVRKTMGDKINFGMRNMEIKKSKPMQI